MVSHYLHWGFEYAPTKLALRSCLGNTHGLLSVKSYYAFTYQGWTDTCKDRGSIRAIPGPPFIAPDGTHENPVDVADEEAVALLRERAHFMSTVESLCVTLETYTTIDDLLLNDSNTCQVVKDLHCNVVL